MVGEAAAGAAGRVGEGVKASVKLVGRNVKKRQETSRVVKRKLDGPFNDINGLRGGGLTFDALGGRVKEGGQERGADGSRSFRNPSTFSDFTKGVPSLRCRKTGDKSAGLA